MFYGAIIIIIIDIMYLCMYTHVISVEINEYLKWECAFYAVNIGKCQQASVGI